MNPDTLREWASECALMGTLNIEAAQYVLSHADAWEADRQRLEAAKKVKRAANSALEALSMGEADVAFDVLHAAIAAGEET